MQRRRSQSVDVGSSRPKYYDGILGGSGRLSFDSNSFGFKFVNFGNRHPARRQSADVERGRRASRVSLDVGTRRHLSYDAWIRTIRVSSTNI